MPVHSQQPRVLRTLAQNRRRVESETVNAVRLLADGLGESSARRCLSGAVELHASYYDCHRRARRVASIFANIASIVAVVSSAGAACSSRQRRFRYARWQKWQRTARPLIGVGRGQSRQIALKTASLLTLVSGLAPRIQPHATLALARLRLASQTARPRTCCHIPVASLIVPL